LSRILSLAFVFSGPGTTFFTRLTAPPGCRLERQPGKKRMETGTFTPSRDGIDSLWTICD